MGFPALMMKGTHGGRIPSLDGFRGISILMVLFSHVKTTAGFPSAIGDWVTVDLGMLGVRVFFVISGFLITTLLLKEESTRGAISLSAFYMRRCFRILPAYYSYLLAVFILSLFVPAMTVPLSAYVTSATFTTGLAGNWGLAIWHNDTWPLSHGWSLAVEEQFYLFWPALLIVMPPGKGRRRFVVGFIIGFALLMRFLFPRNESNLRMMIDHLFLTQADMIMFGCLLALLRQVSRGAMDRLFQFQPVLFRAAAVGLTLFAAFLPLIFTFKLHYTMEAIAVSMEGVGLTYLIGSYTTVTAGIGYGLLNHPALRWIGVLSYSLYLWQQPFLAPKSVYPLTWWQTFPQNLALAFACGLISYHVIEKPFLAMKDHFSRLTTSAKVPVPAG